MLRHKHNTCSIEGGLIQGKIRKRGCPSSSSSTSSSSSSVIQNYRFKRALLVGSKRGGGSNTTPAPTWRINNNNNNNSTSRDRIVTPNSTKQVSARKLVATLWQMNEVPSPRMSRRNRVYSVLSDPSHSPVSDRLDRSRNGGSHCRRNSITSQNKLKLTDHYINGGGGLDSSSNVNLMEVIEIRPRSGGTMTPTTGSVRSHKARVKDVRDGLTNSRELLKVLNRVWGVEEHQSASMSIISALRAEIDRAYVQVNHLVRENPRSDRGKEMEGLLKRFAQEKAAWKCNEQEKREMALKPIKGDLEGERRLRRRTECLNKSLGRELAEAKSALSKATEELETEKRAQEIMKQICDELARGIGEDRAAVEALKRESAMVREEVEKEREMLHLADTLREERVQMKLCEAKYEFEEKNAALDKLKFELEAFLKTKKYKGSRNGRSGKCGSKGDVAIHSSKPNVVLDQIQGGGEVESSGGDLESGEEEGSSDSDLHSIELNVEDARSTGYVWNFGDGGADKEIKGRKSTSHKTTKRNFSIGRRDSDGVGWDFSTDNFSSWGKNYEHDNRSNGQEHNEADTQKHISAKGPRDNMLSRSKTALPPDLAGSTKEWGHHWCSSPNPNTAWESSLKERLAELIGDGRAQETDQGSMELSAS